MRRLLPLLLIGLACASPLPAFAAQPVQAGPEAGNPVALIRLEGAIDVPSSEYLERALKQASGQGAQCLLVLLNTPGGLGEPMMRMTSSLLNAPIPTVVYVYPAGSFAMSAGTFITLAASVAAMHPATTIGAAHPVELIPMPTPEQPSSEKPDTAAKPSEEVMMRKTVNAFAEHIRVIAEQRGRNGDWAERAVRESATASANDALRSHVIDLVANDPRDLLSRIDGREVSLPDGRKVQLQTASAPIVEISPTVKEGFLHVLANPNILLVLLVLAGMGIMFELQNPGAILPGVIGGLCLLLALYAMAVLPINYAGVGLIVFAMLLFLAEVKVVSHGVLTVGGVASFVLGALMLTGTSAPWLRVSWLVIVVMAVLILLFFLFVVGASIRAHMRKVQTGGEGLIGRRARVLVALRPAGQVLAAGTRWQARALEGEIVEGEEAEVVGQDGLTLLVRRRGADSDHTRT